jgi:PHD/YefM family antitoxin component YafN of YafNO toxin-antitoxin module
MINITENTFLQNPKKAIKRLQTENEIIKVVSDEKTYVIIDESDWNNIYETLYLNSIKGYPESIIEASKENLDDALNLNALPNNDLNKKENLVSFTGGKYEALINDLAKNGGISKDEIEIASCRNHYPEN